MKPKQRFLDNPLFAKPVDKSSNAKIDSQRGGNRKTVWIHLDNEKFILYDVAVVIAAIASFTNRSNPSVMFGTELVAHKAFKQVLFVNPWIKTFLGTGL